MSTKKEKCCETLCYCGEDTTIGHFKGVEGCCHSQSESIGGDIKFFKVSSDEPTKFVDATSDVQQAITTAVAKERQRILGLPCMEEEPTEKDSGTIYLKAPLGGDPIPYHESIKLPITENIARNYLRRELKEEINI